jgi:His/Glu/Gln/Arg/opine family amino acid ABC transporter permease subunit
VTSVDTYFNLSVFLKAFPMLLDRLPYTLAIVAVSFVIGGVLGTVLTVLRRTNSRVIKILVDAYVWLLRGTPLLLLLFMAYYGIPMMLQAVGIELDASDPLVFALIAFSMSLSSFFEEVMRAALDSVDSSQYDAAKSLNLPIVTFYRRILIPQALINSLPNLGNLLITAIKQSSILFTIGIADIYEQAVTLSSNDYGLWQLEIFLALMLIYWVLAAIIDKIAALIYASSQKKVA